MESSERSAKIEAYGQGFETLRRALAEVPPGAWKFRPAPDEWSVHEIVCHLADSESMAALRLRKLIVEPGSTLMAYEESAWADRLAYLDHDVNDALEIIRLARQTTYRLLKTLPNEALGHAVVHPEYKEPYTFETWLGIYSRHIPDHVDQLKRAVEAWKARN
jgi:hypothetical protein